MDHSLSNVAVDLCNGGAGLLLSNSVTMLILWGCITIASHIVLTGASSCLADCGGAGAQVPVMESWTLRFIPARPDGC